MDSTGRICVLQYLPVIWTTPESQRGTFGAFNATQQADVPGSQKFILCCIARIDYKHQVLETTTGVDRFSGRYSDGYLIVDAEYFLRSPNGQKAEKNFPESPMIVIAIAERNYLYPNPTVTVSVEGSHSCNRQPRAVKTIAGKFCLFYKEWLKPIVNRAPKCIQDYIKPRFAVFQFEAFLREINAGAEEEFLQVGISRLPRLLEKKKIGTKFFREFVREEATEILSAMTAEKQKHLFNELQKHASKNETSKKSRAYCRIIQQKIVELAVLSHKKELDTHCSSTLSISGKNEKMVEVWRTNFREITSEIFANFNQYPQYFAEKKEDQTISPEVKEDGAQSKINDDLIRKWILEAALPSEKEVKSLMKGIKLDSKIDLLQRIRVISKSDQAYADIWEKLYGRVDSSSNFGTAEFLEKQKVGLLQPGPKIEFLTAKQ
jgi:hypothetical protein